MLANRLIGLRRLGSYDEEVAADSPVARWKLDETSGTTANDSIGSNHGTYAGVTLDQSPLINIGRSVLFSGSSSGITIPDAAALDLGANFTLVGWGKTAATAEQELVMKEQVGSIWPAYSLRMLANGTVRCSVFGASGGSPVVTATTTATINDNIKHRVSAMFRGSTDLKIYIDGVQRASVTHSSFIILFY